jgi:hypothetical protein
MVLTLLQDIVKLMFERFRIESMNQWINGSIGVNRKPDHGFGFLRRPLSQHIDNKAYLIDFAEIGKIVYAQSVRLFE